MPAVKPQPGSLLLRAPEKRSLLARRPGGDRKAGKLEAADCRDLAAGSQTVLEVLQRYVSASESRAERLTICLLISLLRRALLKHRRC